MAPKKAGATTAKKGSAAPAAHASYQDMIKEAIINLKDRTGSSRQAIKKYVKANNAGIKNTSDGMFTSNINRALAAGVDAGVFLQPKGPSGPVKINKDTAAKPAAKKEPVAKESKPATKTATKKTATKAAPKKTATKKTTTKAAPKKAAAKPKANAGRPRKTVPAKAPAVEEKHTVLTKTKSGRVTKTTAPQIAAKSGRKAPAKKAPLKKATPKKSA